MSEIYNTTLVLSIGIGIYFLWRDRSVIFWDQENFENTLEQLNYNFYEMKVPY